MPTAPANAHRLDLTVVKTDVDDQGHASNVAIVRYFSKAAGDHSASLGWPPSAYQELGGMFVVRRHEVDYHAQAMEGERLICWTWPSGLAKATAERRFRLVREGDGQMVAKGRSDWAFVDIETGRPQRIPPVLRQTFDPAQFA